MKDAKVNVYNLQGEYISTYNDIKEASKNTKVNENKILGNCLRRKKFADNYQFRFDDGSNANIPPITQEEIDKDNKLHLERKKENEELFEIYPLIEKYPQVEEEPKKEYPKYNLEDYRITREQAIRAMNKIARQIDGDWTGFEATIIFNEPPQDNINEIDSNITQDEQFFFKKEFLVYDDKGNIIDDDERWKLIVRYKLTTVFATYQGDNSNNIWICRNNRLSKRIKEDIQEELPYNPYYPWLVMDRKNEIITSVQTKKEYMKLPKEITKTCYTRNIDIPKYILFDRRTYKYIGCDKTIIDLIRKYTNLEHTVKPDCSSLFKKDLLVLPFKSLDRDIQDRVINLDNKKRAIKSGNKSLLIEYTDKLLKNTIAIEIKQK